MIRDPSDGSLKPPIKTIDDLKARYGPNWGLNVDEQQRRPPVSAPTIEELQRFYTQNPERIVRLMGEQGE